MEQWFSEHKTALVVIAIVLAVAGYWLYQNWGHCEDSTGILYVGLPKTDPDWQQTTFCHYNNGTDTWTTTYADGSQDVRTDSPDGTTTTVHNPPLPP